MDLQELADRLEIQEQLSRYARGVDTNDYELWKSVFTPDAMIDYTSTSSSLPVADRDTMASYLEAGLGKAPMKIHYITNFDITFDGDTAKVIAQFYNPFQIHESMELSYCGGYYFHDFVRTPDGWKSKALREELVWFVNRPDGA
jgi:hypothetical protein